MSSSSSWSCSGSWTGEPGLRKPPIPYRVGPLEYEPDVLCKCGVKAARWISWSNDNPGRRYFGCYRAREGGCDFRGWYEGPVDSFVQNCLLIYVILKQEVERLEKELQRLEDEAKKQTVSGRRMKTLETERFWLMVVCVFFAAALFIMWSK